LPQRFVGHVLRGREVRPQVRPRDCGADTPLYTTWGRGQTWQDDKARSLQNDQALRFLEILRQTYAIAKYMAGHLEPGVAERMDRSEQLLWQAVEEAQREHEARYGPQAAPIQEAGRLEVISFDVTTGRRQRYQLPPEHSGHPGSESPDPAG